MSLAMLSDILKRSHRKITTNLIFYRILRSYSDITGEAFWRTGKIILFVNDQMMISVEKVGQWILIGPLSPKRWTLVSAWVIYDKSIIFPH